MSEKSIPWTTDSFHHDRSFSLICGCHVFPIKKLGRCRLCSNGLSEDKSAGTNWLVSKFNGEPRTTDSNIVAKKAVSSVRCETYNFHSICQWLRRGRNSSLFSLKIKWICPSFPWVHATICWNMFSLTWGTLALQT